MEIPFQVMKTSYQSMEVMYAMVQTGNPNSVTDAGVGALAARSAVLGAALNVRVNAGGLNDKEYVDNMLREVNELVEKTIEKEKEILQVVNEKIGK
jgi:glutamate formiminotransferase/formiminotetrahydrofolate cyclodeaminase